MKDQEAVRNLICPLGRLSRLKRRIGVDRSKQTFYLWFGDKPLPVPAMGKGSKGMLLNRGC